MSFTLTNNADINNMTSERHILSDASCNHNIQQGEYKKNNDRPLK